MCMNDVWVENFERCWIYIKKVGLLTFFFTFFVTHISFFFLVWQKNIYVHDYPSSLQMHARWWREWVELSQRVSKWSKKAENLTEMEGKCVMRCVTLYVCSTSSIIAHLFSDMLFWVAWNEDKLSSLPLLWFCVIQLSTTLVYDWICAGHMHSVQHCLGSLWISE